MESALPNADNLLTSAIKTDEHDLRLAQLVASYSLLDPERRSSRRDVVISTLVTVLSARQPMTSTRLFGAIRSMWKTSTLNDEILSTALEHARAAGLVIERHVEEQKHYYVSADAATETMQDHAHISHLLEDFRNLVSERLDEYPDADKLATRQDRIVGCVLTAIARACHGSFAIDAPGSSTSVRPITVSQSAVIGYANLLDPKSIRIPVKELALDALDTGEPFGNEIVHLIVVSGLLLGLTAQQGINEAPSLNNSNIILDTSVLVGLVKSDDDSERKTLLELISLSQRCKATIVVPQHTIDEWSRLWNGADAEMKGMEDRVATISSVILNRIVRNPFVATYIEYLSNGGEHSWARWSTPIRNLRDLLRSLPVAIERYAEHGRSNSRCYDLLLATIVEMSDNEDIPGTRSRSSAEADAMTGTMIYEWREQNGEGTAVFVARDSLTNRAYTSCFPDAKPLVIQPMIWLQYVSCLIVDDPLTRIEIADLIADVAVRDTVLSMAGAHTLDEVLSFSDLLTRENILPNAQMIRDFDDPVLFDSTDSLHQESSEAFSVKAQAVIARRSIRRNQQAVNRQARFQSELDSVQKAADQRAKEADTQRSRAESEERRADMATLEKDELAEKNMRLQRIIHAGIASGVAIVLLIALVWLGLLGWIAILLGGIAAAAGIYYAYHWVGNIDSRPSRMWISASCQIVWNLVLSIVF